MLLAPAAISESSGSGCVAIWPAYRERATAHRYADDLFWMQDDNSTNGKNERNFVFKVSICFRGLNDMCSAFAVGMWSERTSTCVCVCGDRMCMHDRWNIRSCSWVADERGENERKIHLQLHVFQHNQDKFVVVKMWRQWKMGQRFLCRRRSLSIRTLYLGLGKRDDEEMPTPKTKTKTRKSI